MSSDKHTQSEVAEKFWDALEETRMGFLGMTSTGSHQMQPMTAFGERDNRQIWFFTSKQTDLAREAGKGGDGMFNLVAKDRKLWACVRGTLSERFDRARIEEHWNPIVAAWYPEGKDDPNLTLLCLDLEDADLWIDEGGPLKLAWEVAKANLTKTLPDEGERAHLNFQ